MVPSAVRPAMGVRILSTSALAVGMLVTWAPHAEAAVQVTRAEYRQVQIGMTQARVRAIVGAAGRVSDSYGTCVIKEYSGWNGQEVGFFFDDHDGDGTVTLRGKKVGADTVFVSCPRPG